MTEYSISSDEAAEERARAAGLTQSPSQDDLRAKRDEVRAELGATVEELSRRVDVPARVRAQKSAAMERVRADAERVSAVASSQLTAVRATVRRSPATVVAAGAAVVLIVGLLLRRTRRR